MAEYYVGFLPDPLPTDSAAMPTRTFTADAIDLDGYNNTIPSRHLVVANQRIKRAGMLMRAATNGVEGTCTGAAYVADETTNNAGARVGEKYTFPRSINTPAVVEIDVDISLADVVGEYIKPAGGYSNGARPYYSTGTSGHGVYREAQDCPDPFGTQTNTTQLYVHYFIVEDVAPSPTIVSIDGQTEDFALPNEKTNVVIVTGNCPTIVEVRLDDWIGEVVSHVDDILTVNLPVMIDGILWGELPQEKTLTLFDELDVPVEEAILSAPIEVTIPDGMAKVVFADADVGNINALAYYLNSLGYSVSDGAQVYYPTASGLIIYPNSSIEISALITVVIWHSDEISGIWNSFSVTMENNAVVSADIHAKGLAAVPIKAKRIFARSI